MNRPGNSSIQPLRRPSEERMSLDEIFLILFPEAMLLIANISPEHLQALYFHGDHQDAHRTNDKRNKVGNRIKLVISGLIVIRPLKCLL